MTLVTLASISGVFFFFFRGLSQEHMGDGSGGRFHQPFLAHRAMAPRAYAGPFVLQGVISFLDSESVYVYMSV